MKKFNSNEFHEIKKYYYNKNDINVNLWDLEGSNFFIDKNIKKNEQKIDYNQVTLKNKSNSISSKKIYKNIKSLKIKNKSTHSSFVKYNNIIDKKFVKNDKDKSLLNSRRKNKKYNSFFDYGYKKNSFENYLNDAYKKKAKKRFNYSVDYSRNEISNISKLFSNNNDLLNKNQRINCSLLIDTLNNKTDNMQKKNNNNISNLKNNKNITSIKYSSSNKREKTNTENNINKNINFNIRNIKNINQSLYNNLIKKKKDLKLNDENINSQKSRKKTPTTKRTKENAEKYTNYLYKRKIFTQDYELQNKIKKEKEESEAQKELAQCTFKPRLYSNKYNNKIQSKKSNQKNKSIYEKNSQWSNKLKLKRENERKKKLMKEKEGCTFIPQISTLPKYKNKKKSISNREIIGEENYYNKMKKARKIMEEKKKGKDLVEKYDERKKRNETLPRSIVTFGNFNLDKIEASEESINPNNNNNNNNINYLKKENYSFKNNISDLNINENIINNESSERTINNNLNNLNFNNNSFIYDNNIPNKQISLGNLDISNKKNNNINIDTSKFINEKIILNKKSESSKNKINSSIIYDIYNGNLVKTKDKINERMKIINSKNQYQRENNYDFDNNYFDEKFFNKNKLNSINNSNFLNPTINYEEKGQERENPNNSTGTVTKANSIVSLQKKSTHSLPDRPGNMDNLFCYNLNDYRFDKEKENNIINNKLINDNLQDEEFIRQKKLLMNELHNLSNYEEDSNYDY